MLQTFLLRTLLPPLLVEYRLRAITVAHTYNPRTPGKERQEDQEFKVILGYILNLRRDWTIGDTVKSITKAAWLGPGAFVSKHINSRQVLPLVFI